LVPVGAQNGFAHDVSGVSLTGFGTAAIDGVMSPGEWDTADTISFQANVPEGGTTPATLFVMNDADNLYLAVAIERSSLDRTSVTFEYDNDHDGVSTDGDDTILMNAGPAISASFSDNFRPSGAVDTSDGGTNDGVADASNDGTFSVYEQSHPLNTADDAHDFSLEFGDTVGFRLFIRMLPPTTDTFLPPGISSTDQSTYGHIIIATSEIKVVGGELIPIDSTALILAGAQTNAVWMLSALAVIGSVAFGALYITKRKTENS